MASAPLFAISAGSESTSNVNCRTLCPWLSALSRRDAILSNESRRAARLASLDRDLPSRDSVACEANRREPGARALGIEWVELMETGFSLEEEVRDMLVEQLIRLREWMLREYGPGSYDIERLDGLVGELKAVQFGGDLEVFVG